MQKNKLFIFIFFLTKKMMHTQQIKNAKNTFFLVSNLYKLDFFLEKGEGEGVTMLLLKQ